MLQVRCSNCGPTLNGIFKNIVWTAQSCTYPSTYAEIFITTPYISGSQFLWHVEPFLESISLVRYSSLCHTLHLISYLEAILWSRGRVIDSKECKVNRYLNNSDLEILSTCMIFCQNLAIEKVFKSFTNQTSYVSIDFTLLIKSMK